MTETEPSWDDETGVVVSAPTPPAPGRSGVAVILGALALVAAIVAGAYLVTDDDAPTEVAAEQTDDTAEPTDDSADVGSDDTAPADEVDDDDGDAAERAAADTELAIDRGAGGSEFHSGPGMVFAVDGGFAALGWGPDGLTLQRSDDGLEWEASELTGLPSEGGLNQIARYDGGYVGVFEEWPVFEGDDALPFPSVEIQPSYYVATSTDLASWSLTELPDFPSVGDRTVYTSVNGIAAAGGRFAAVVEQHPEGPDEMRILYEAGVLDDTTVHEFCGSDFRGPDEPITLYSCDHEALDEAHFELEQALSEASTDEERAAIEAELEQLYASEQEQEELAVIEPGTPVHDEMIAAFTFDWEPPAPLVLSGPVAGPWNVARLPGEGYAGSIAATDAGFVVAMQDFTARRPQSTVFTSVDGLDWTETTTLDDVGIHQLTAAGDTFVAFGQGGDDGGAAVLVSTDGGVTWSESDLGADLYGVWAEAVSGPAGTAIQVQGSVEPYPVFEPPPIVLEADGHTLTMHNGPGDLWVTLVDTSGAIVHEVTYDQLDEVAEPFGTLVIDGVLEADDTGDMTFLDPATGEPLATFTQAMFEDAWAEIDFPEHEFEEPDMASEVFFSADGATWTSLGRTVVSPYRGSHRQLMAVGDDEVLFFDYLGEDGGWERVPLG